MSSHHVSPIDSVEFLIMKLTSHELLSFARQEGFVADLDRWLNILRRIYPVLEDAEGKHINNPVVKSWLADLKKLAYDVEVILAEFARVALKRKQSHQLAEASTSKVRKLISTCCANFIPRYIKFSNVKMRYVTKKITARLEDIAEQIKNLDLRETLEGKFNVFRLREQLPRPPTTFVYRGHIFGRERDQEAILELLLKDEGQEDGISVIPIVGMAGVGKTTLAQIVYNDARVERQFEIKAWACVSRDFDVPRVTHAILQSISGSYVEYSSDLIKLQVQLMEKLVKKKILIVLDDIWNLNDDELTCLFSPLRACGSSGSKIIITTRNKQISSMVGTVPTYLLKELPYEDCLSIFTLHSLGRNDFNECPDLKEVGEKIVNKCKGLPLTAKFLGNILKGRLLRGDWQRVLNRKIFGLWDERTDILATLKLSYDDLPLHLKRCFAYCSLLPKDREFETEEVIFLWLTKGFLQREYLAKQMENVNLSDLAAHYFDELQSRSFFQQSSNDTSRYVMHDLMHDLAQLVARLDFFFGSEGDDGEYYGVGGEVQNMKNESVGGGDGNGGNDNGDKDKGDGDDNIQIKNKDGDNDGDGKKAKDIVDNIIGGGKMKGIEMDFMGEPGYGYNYGNHAGYENGYLVGQLHCGQAFWLFFILYYFLKYYNNFDFGERFQSRIHHLIVQV